MSALSSDCKYVKGELVVYIFGWSSTILLPGDLCLGINILCYTGWWRLGTALDTMDMKEEALQAFACALQLDPRYCCIPLARSACRCILPCVS
jgi:hypothetical protein